MTTTMTPTDHTDAERAPAPTPTPAVSAPAADPHAGSVRPTAVRPAPAQATLGDRLARNVLERLLGRLRGGSLTIVDHEGTATTYGQGSHGGTDPSATVRLMTPAVWSEVARKGSRGLGESYVDGWWDTDDLVGLIRVLLRNLGLFDQIRNTTARATAPVLDPWRRRRRPSKDRDRREIAAHYDLGNDFFELFLDPTMAYSCGLFPDPKATLHEAQIAKFDRLLSSIDVGPGDRLVEIGTGWGGLAVHAAQRFGAQVTTTTISEQQHRHATALVSELGLQDQVTVLLEDYRDLHGTYDKLVSVEMIEAVDWRDHDAFFGACNRLLSPQGRMAMQAITVADNRFGRVRNSEDFVKRHIFPGSCIPSIDAITTSTARSTDFWLTHLEEFPQHYAETLHRWRSALDAKADLARSRGYDDALLRLWDFYLAYCEGAFAERYVSLVQVVLERPGSVPTRPGAAVVTEPRKMPTPLSFRLLDWGLVPDPVLRAVCTLRTRNRLRVERSDSVEAQDARTRRLRESLRKAAVATHTDEANQQHYEVPTEFFARVLGPKRKYSSCYWPEGVATLAEAEDAMLELYAQRAGLADGQRILELGCGWGSFCLWAARRWPDSEIVAVSNSRTQRTYIEAQAAADGLDNLTVLTADVTTFDPAELGCPGPFDRIVSIEMLEHISNHEELFGRISRWLAPDGRFFAHIFTGNDVAFAYDADDPRDWMGRYFFSGGLMPSDDWFLHLQSDLVCTDHWQLSGIHYRKTADAWIDNHRHHRAELLDALSADIGRRRARVQYRRWRAFFMGCAQLWGYRGGRDFGVSHYLFEPRPRPTT